MPGKYTNTERRYRRWHQTYLDVIWIAKIISNRFQDKMVIKNVVQIWKEDFLASISNDIIQSKVYRNMIKSDNVSIIQKHRNNKSLQNKKDSNYVTWVLYLKTLFEEILQPKGGKGIR